MGIKDGDEGTDYNTYILYLFVAFFVMKWIYENFIDKKSDANSGETDL